MPQIRKEDEVKVKGHVQLTQFVDNPKKIQFAIEQLEKDNKPYRIEYDDGYRLAVFVPEKPRETLFNKGRL